MKASDVKAIAMTKQHLRSLVVLAVTLGACGLGGSAELPPGSRTERLAFFYAQRTTEEQRPVLEDGIVTAAEYEAAMLSVSGCLDDAGIGHSPLEQRLDGFTLDFTYEGDGFDERKMDGCFNEHVFDIAQVWTQQHIPDGEQRAELARAYAQCVEDAGVDLNGLTDPQSLSIERDRQLNAGLIDNAQDEAVSLCDAQYWVLFMDPVSVDDL